MTKRILQIFTILGLTGLYENAYAECNCQCFLNGELVGSGFTASSVSDCNTQCSDSDMKPANSCPTMELATKLSKIKDEIKANHKAKK
jgi:hypothetical protein